MPKVSVLMPVYNAEQYLAEAIDSIISQSFEDWELILINDGSTDNSESVIARYDDDRINYIKNAENIGLIKTLNKGIDFCHGEYIARMDGDDISLPDRLKLQVDFLDRHPAYLMCGTNAKVIDNSGERTGKIRNLRSNNYLQINLLFSPPFVHPSVMIRREVLKRNQYDEAYKHVEDYELWCRIAKLGKVANLSKELLAYRWHSSNVSVVNNRMQDELKDTIIRDELVLLGVDPSADELYCHKITFNLYSLGEKQSVSIDRFDAISKWFSKLVGQNKIKRRYNRTDFMAFLWARWIVLCISQSKYKKIVPSFASFNPVVQVKLLGLILFLRNK